MPQRVRRDALVDPCGLGGGADNAAELAGRQWLDRVAAWKQPASRQQQVAPPPLAPPRHQARKSSSSGGDSIASSIKRSRFLVNTVASHTAASSDSPTNQRY